MSVKVKIYQATLLWSSVKKAIWNGRPLESPIQESNGSKSGPRRKHCYKTSKFVKMHQERGFLLANAWGGETGDMSSSSSWRLYRLVGDHLGKRWFHRSQGTSSSSGHGKSSRFKFQDNKSRCVKRKILAQILCSFSSLRIFTFALSLIRLVLFDRRELCKQQYVLV